MWSESTCRLRRYNNICNYVYLRQDDYSTRSLPEYVRRRCVVEKLPHAIKENELSLGEVDKIFAAKWLDECHIICGTKCNKLIVQNIESGRICEIPVLKCSGNVPWPQKNCGIHDISINVDSTTLVTGAENPNSIGFYHLPSLQPICIGEFHHDWMFTAAWISNDIVVTGSRDKRLAYWKLSDSQCNGEDHKSNPSKKIATYPIIKPMQTIDGENLGTVRDMVYNPYKEHLATVGSNGFVHLWDTKTYSQIASHVLPFFKENVCIAHEGKYWLYAVGSSSHVTLVESRTVKVIGSFCTNENGAGVRSISFNDFVLTIGTGYGSILFYDIRRNEFLPSHDGSQCQLKSGHGWLRKDSIYREFFWDMEYYPNAIYAHSYHPATMKLLTAGGPLALGLHGNYAAYWG